jgi:hypothetical protein
MLVTNVLKRKRTVASPRISWLNSVTSSAQLFRPSILKQAKFYNSMTDRSLKDSRLTTASQLAKSVKKKELKYSSIKI